MADQNLTQLTPTTSPTSDALVYIVDDPTGTPADRVISLTTLLKSSGGQEQLTDDRIYYVRTDGSDTNTGLANTAGGAFLTIQHAIDTIMGSVNLAGFDVTIQLGDGTYTEQIVITAPWTGNGTVTIAGNTTTPDNVILTNSSGSNLLEVANNGRLNIHSLKMTPHSSSRALVAVNHSNIFFYDITFSGGANSYHIYTFGNSRITSSGNYRVASGTYLYHIYATDLSSAIIDNSCICSGTPVFSGALLFASYGSIIDSPIMSGAYTGGVYATNNSLLRGLPNPAGVYVDSSSVASNSISVESRRFYVTAQQDITSSTTLVDITQLTTNTNHLQGNFRFVAKLFTTSNVAGGIKVGIGTSGSFTTSTYEVLIHSGGTITQGRSTTTGITAVTAAFVTIEGYIDMNTDGDFSIMFAQNASNGAATSILVGSYLELYDIIT